MRIYHWLLVMSYRMRIRRAMDVVIRPILAADQRSRIVPGDTIYLFDAHGLVLSLIWRRNSTLVVQIERSDFDCGETITRARSIAHRVTLGGGVSPGNPWKR